jgi:hypothetical protein
MTKSLIEELTYTWWIVRRMSAWAAKIPDNSLPPISEDNKTNNQIQGIVSKNILWDGTIINQMDNI